MTYFQSRRPVVTARRGAVATSQPLAAQIGLQVLIEGGNAVDGAVATAAALGVVEPHMTGIGGDVFALVWDAKLRQVTALNSSGRAGGSVDAEAIRARGYSAIPSEGKDAGLSVTVPGAVAGWDALLEKHGSMSLSDLLEPAIILASEGFAVSEFIAWLWQEFESKLTRLPSGRELLPGGKAPHFGDVVTLPTLARTYQTLKEGGVDAFYQGELASKISNYVQAHGGYITVEDLVSHRSDWVTPICTDYRGVTVWECPPNGQGLSALMALNIAEGFDIGEMGPQSTARYHHLIESMRLAFADAFRFIADPNAVDVPASALLEKSYAETRRTAIQPSIALPKVGHGCPTGASDTVYVTVVDAQGNACSLINSLYESFGSGLVVPGTGVILQSRGGNFNLDPEHPNVIAGGKRPYHTLMPGLATRDGELWLSFGVMGGFQQPQGHLQVISNLVDFGMNPQAALDALRFKIDVLGDWQIDLEAGLDTQTIEGLAALGHRTNVVDGYDRELFGGGQVIARDPETGVLRAGSEPRNDGVAVGW